MLNKGKSNSNGEEEEGERAKLIHTAFDSYGKNLKKNGEKQEKY